MYSQLTTRRLSVHYRNLPMTNDEGGYNAFFVYFYSGIPKVNKNHGLFTYTIMVCSVFVMYIINILYLYCLFVAQWSVRSGLHVSLNYPCTPSPTLPRIIESTRYFVSLTTYVGKSRSLSCFLTIWYPSLASPFIKAHDTLHRFPEWLEHLQGSLLLITPYSEFLSFWDELHKDQQCVCTSYYRVGG